MTSASSPYQPQYDRGNCGVGFVVNVRGERSHDIVQKGLTVLQNLTHRGACGCDPLTGDGAGILVQIPDAFFRREAKTLRIELPAAGRYGVGMVFLPAEVNQRNECERIAGHAVDPEALAVGVFFFNPHHVSGGMKLAESALHHHGLQVAAWREVPVDPDVLGDQARLTMPRILHAIVKQQSVVSRQSSAVSRQPSAISNPPSTI